MTVTDLASQGYVPDIYTAFFAWGWHWGGKYLNH